PPCCVPWPLTHASWAACCNWRATPRPPAPPCGPPAHCWASALHCPAAAVALTVFPRRVAAEPALLQPSVNPVRLALDRDLRTPAICAGWSHFGADCDAVG